MVTTHNNQMVLIDTPHKNGYSHMIADTIEALHSHAELCGIARCWYENKKGKNRPHYDVKAKDYDKVVSLGAQPVSRRTIITKLREWYQ